MMLGMALVCLLLVPLKGSGFLQPSSGALYRGARHKLSAGFNLNYHAPSDSAQLDPVKQQEAWEREYKAYLKRNGMNICAMSWKGFKQSGRGAIFARYDDSNNAAEVHKVQAVPSLYVELGKWDESSHGMEPGSKDAENLRAILSRIERYDPNKEFVCVFEAAGLMGADIVRPSHAPPVVAESLFSEDAGSDVVDVAASDE